MKSESNTVSSAVNKATWLVLYLEEKVVNLAPTMGLPWVIHFLFFAMVV
jgi:hypothetical protein